MDTSGHSNNSNSCYTIIKTAIVSKQSKYLKKWRE